MEIVTTEFVYYDDGCFPTVHAVGDTVTGDVAAFAVAQGFVAVPVEDVPKPSGKKGK